MAHDPVLAGQVLKVVGISIFVLLGIFVICSLVVGARVDEAREKRWGAAQEKQDK